MTNRDQKVAKLRELYSPGRDEMQMQIIDHHLATATEENLDYALEVMTKIYNSPQRTVFDRAFARHLANISQFEK
jgi:hypothetical protein